MKNIQKHIKSYLLLVFLVTSTLGHSQIAVNTSPNTTTCNLGAYGPVTISVPTEVLTGDNIALNITLPGTLPVDCEKTVTITRTSNLSFQSSGGVLFNPVSGFPLQYENSDILSGNDGQNFNVFFKFPGYITCNGTVGTFDVTVSTTCAGVTTTCTTSVSVIARADNYWTITKEFYTGDLTCGTSVWRIKLNHNNPNGSGLGTYKITGSITETPSVPIVSGATHTVNYSLPYNTTISKYVTLQNCSNSGTTITNTANYNFTLGDGTCDTMVGTVTATSPPLASPNASISFTKYVSSSYYTNLTPGCDAMYYLSVCNNGNVPWTNLQITDNLNIPGINITNIVIPSGWTSTPVIPPYIGTTYNFDAPPGFVLNPGECKYIYIYFQIDSGATIGSTINNSAQLSYMAFGTGGSGGSGGPSPCPLISCPTLDTSVQNTTASVDFVVEAPKSIPSIKKCIVDPPNALIPPIYQIGDPIKFSVMIGNSGAGDLNTILTDALGMPGQNLQLTATPVTYTYYPNQNKGYKNSCNPPFGGGMAPPFSVVQSGVPDNPIWTITNMPGICDYNKSNFLVIEFEAIILPQLSGTKTNTASIPNGSGTLTSPVNYSIDQVGILSIHKEADAEIVENGQSFNYTITVSNGGSVPLDNIVVTDMLPDCVSVNGQISIIDGLSATVPFTSTGNVIINVNPSTQIQPGEDFIITIPVVKSGGGNCCNESVSVTADMVTTGVELNANYGSPEAPAACVTGTECCDIEDFEASIQQNNDTYNITINGGSVPLQEVEISMVDYHIEYSEEECIPDDLGIFGTLTTTNTTLGNLILNSGDNGTSSLSWLLGSPSIINGGVNLNILDPNALNLDCCDVEFYFCIKVRVQDVNCNVCEKIICFSSEGDPIQTEPCDLKITNTALDQKLCPGDTIPINWTGTAPSGAVNIYLYDNTNSVIYQVIATGIPNTGSFTYTIPSTIPCDPPRSWSIIIEDSHKECSDRSNPFTIECCEQHGECDCGEWTTNFVSFTQYHQEIPQNSTHKININSTFQNQIPCGKSVQLKQHAYYSFTAPDYVCNPENCDESYEWKITLPGGSIVSSTGKILNFNFSTTGIYQIEIIPICGGQRCPPCKFNVHIKGIGGHDNPNFKEEKFQFRQDFGPIQGSRNKN